MAKDDLKFSVIIRTQNSGETIVNTLESVCTFGEIIAIDEHSSDDTVDILREYRVKTIFADKTNLKEAYNQAITEAKGEWILVLEDDEIVSRDLLDNLNRYAQNPKKNKYAVSFKIKTFYLNKEIKSASQKNVIRFFKKDCCSFNENKFFNPCLNMGKVYNISDKIKDGCILKYLQGDIIRFLDKIIEKNKNILKTSNKISASVVLSPIFTFFYFYILKMGFLEGYRGYIFAKEMFIEKFIFEVMVLEKKIKG